MKKILIIILLFILSLSVSRIYYQSYLQSKAESELKIKLLQQNVEALQETKALLIEPAPDMNMSVDDESSDGLKEMYERRQKATDTPAGSLLTTGSVLKFGNRQHVIIPKKEYEQLIQNQNKILEAIQSKK